MKTAGTEKASLYEIKKKEVVEEGDSKPILGGIKTEPTVCKSALQMKKSKLLYQGTWARTEANLAKLLSVSGPSTAFLFPPKHTLLHSSAVWQAAPETTPNVCTSWYSVPCVIPPLILSVG